MRHLGFVLPHCWVGYWSHSSLGCHIKWLPCGLDNQHLSACQILGSYCRQCCLLNWPVLVLPGLVRKLEMMPTLKFCWGAGESVAFTSFANWMSNKDWVADMIYIQLWIRYLVALEFRIFTCQACNLSFVVGVYFFLLWERERECSENLFYVRH